MKRYLYFLIPVVLCACSKNSVRQSVQITELTEPNNASVSVQNSEAEDEVKTVHEEKLSQIDIVSEEEYLASYADTDSSLTKPKMVFVEGNSNQNISSFEIGETEVTIEQYCSVIGETEFNKEWGKHPIAGINWFEAIMFCNKLSVMNGYEPCYTLNGEKDTSLWTGELPYYTEAEGHVGDISEWNAIRCNFNANGYRLPTKKRMDICCTWWK